MICKYLICAVVYNFVVGDGGRERESQTYEVPDESHLHKGMSVVVR